LLHHVSVHAGTIIREQSCAWLKLQIWFFLCSSIQTQWMLWQHIDLLCRRAYKIVMQWNHNFPILKLRFIAPKQALVGIDWVVAIRHILLKFFYFIACLGAAIPSFNNGKLWIHFITVLSGGLCILKRLGWFSSYIWIVQFGSSISSAYF
jgi:hypothetical protein